MGCFWDKEFSCLTGISVAYAFLLAKACQEGSLSGLDSESDGMMGCECFCLCSTRDRTTLVATLCCTGGCEYRNSTRAWKLHYDRIEVKIGGCKEICKIK